MAHRLASLYRVLESGSHTKTELLGGRSGYGFRDRGSCMSL